MIEIFNNQSFKKKFFKLAFTPGKAEHLLRGMELQEKEIQKDKEIHLERS